MILELTKFKVSLFAAFSVSVGFVLARQGISREIILPVIGVFFLGCGSCALNQYQEREVDQLMARTQGRPIPSMKLLPSVALRTSLFLLFLGAFFILLQKNWIALGLGVFVLIWYNGFYTPLKRKTAFATVPGALIGAVPPVLGWVSGGGHPFDPSILAVAFFFFIWQIPHFWLLLLNFGKDYEKAGFPSLTKIFMPVQLRRITFTWVFATAVACLMIPLFGLVNFYGIRVGFLVAGFWLIWKAFMLLKSHHSEFSPRPTFNSINVYVLLVMFLLTLDHLL
jgi:protoheme IX farnesyltransferase